MTAPPPNTWMRLEVSPRDATLNSGLAAPVADPLWLLGRQLAAGELTGIDGGSPILTRLYTDRSVFTRLRGRVAAVAPQLLPASSAPLEVLIEAEAEPGPVYGGDSGTSPWPVPYPNRPIASAQAGLHYLRMLAAAPGIGDTSTYVRGLIATYPIPATLGASGPPRPPDNAPLLRVFAGHAPDGQALYVDLITVRDTPARLPDEPPRGAANDQAVLNVAQRWLDWCDATASTPHTVSFAEHPTWNPDRLEYQVDLAAPGPGDETVFTVGDYGGDGLDWWHFDLLGSQRSPATDDQRLGAALSDPAATGQITTESSPIYALAAPVHYAGAPNSRWFTFEDAAINFGDVTAPQESLTTSVLIEYALIYGNDHFLIPLRIPVGTLCRVTDLVVTDTFGQQIRIRPIADIEPDGPFRLFEHTMVWTDVRDSLFVLFPTLTHVTTGPPIEEVHYLRDEIAETVWAIEATALGPTGAPVDRSSEARARYTGTPTATTREPGQPAEFTYHLRTDVEENWFAFSLPDRLPPGPDQPVSDTIMPFTFIPPVDPIQPVPFPWGAILATQTSGLPQEEVTRAGLKASRLWCSARWTDGQHLAWVTRRTEAGRGQGASGLRFDITS